MPLKTAKASIRGKEQSAVYRAEGSVFKPTDMIEVDWISVIVCIVVDKLIEIKGFPFADDNELQGHHT